MPTVKFTTKDGQTFEGEVSDVVAIYRLISTPALPPATEPTKKLASNDFQNRQRRRNSLERHPGEKIKIDRIFELSNMLNFGLVQSKDLYMPTLHLSKDFSTTSYCGLVQASGGKVHDGESARKGCMGCINRAQKLVPQTGAEAMSVTNAPSERERILAKVSAYDSQRE